MHRYNNLLEILLRKFNPAKRNKTARPNPKIQAQIRLSGEKLNGDGFKKEFIPTKEANKIIATEQIRPKRNIKFFIGVNSVRGYKYIFARARTMMSLEAQFPGTSLHLSQLM